MTRKPSARGRSGAWCTVVAFTLSGLAAVASAAAVTSSAERASTTPRGPRRLLERSIGSLDLALVLMPVDAWHPFPRAGEPGAFDGLSDEQRRAFVSAAERELGTGWSTLPASTFLAYVRTGDRASYERLANQRRHKLGLLLLGEVLEGKGRFADAIADGIWLICEESFWGTPAHLDAEQRGLPDVARPIVELFSAETAALLAWTDYLVGDRLDGVHPRLRRRLRSEVDRRLLTPALERDDFWWLGFGARPVNNWNPWINTNWLTANLLLESDPARRARAVARIARSLDRFIDSYPEDGGCDEGPGYWGRAAASLFEALELLSSASGGRVEIWREPILGAMARFIARAHVKDEYFVDIGDAPAKVSPEAELVYRFGKAVADPGLAAFGAWLAQRRGPFGPADVGAYGSPGRSLPALALAREIATAPAAEPLDGESYLPDLQMMMAREQPGSWRGLYVAAWGGHNAQSHNHNDVGNLIVYGDGRPVLVDAGVGEYTAQTFGPRRYEIWTMQSGWHNLPSINGADQKEGSEFRARDVSFASAPRRLVLSLDIAPAWPARAGVRRWRREIALDRTARELVLAEDYALASCREPVRLHFLTPRLPDLSTAGRVLLPDAGGRAYELLYDAKRFAASAEERRLDDRRLSRAWGERLFRVVLSGTTCRASDRHRVVVREVRP